jgi:hypothetical protein
MRTWTLIGCLANVTPNMTYLQLAVGITLLVIILILGAAILVGLWTGKINLSLLLEESGGGASMSRFQLLVFTFVIGLSFFFIVAGTGKFPDPIPKEVLMLLGISATTYGVSKGIQGAGGLENKGGGSDGGNGDTAKSAADKAAAAKAAADKAAGVGE